MSAKPQIVKTGQQRWENRHQNFVQTLEGLYDLWNADTDDLIAGYNEMTRAIQEFIGQAIADRTTVRALGAGWSLSRVAATEGRMLNTKGLNWIFNLSGSSVSPQYSGSRQHLVMAQCGVSIRELNVYLQKKNQGLPTSGASNGQTIAGALSTGTHGSAFDVGSIPEYVAGLHLVTGPDRHIWLERASHPVVSDEMVQRLGAELLRDDALFNAALVSFGSFGFIHGILIETEDLYLLEGHRKIVPFDASLRQLMGSLHFDGAALLPHQAERPCYFQTTVNPHDLDNGIFVNIKYKRPYHDGVRGFWDEFGPGDDLPAVLGTLGDVAPGLIPMAVKQVLQMQYKTFSDQWGTPGETFSNSSTRGKVLSAAVGIPLEAVNAATDLLLDLNRREGPFNGVFAHRYVRSTAATLGFTRFEPVTCVLELDGVISNSTLRFCEKAWDALEAAGIPFTFHWGKLSVLHPARLERMYGDRVAAWKAARRQLLDPESLAVFTNRQMEEWGLGENGAAVAAPAVV